MTFDDGIVGIYEISDIQQEAGKKPVKGLRHTESFYFGYETLGLNRYYTALEANQQIESVIHIPDWHELNPALHIAILENGKQYILRMVQPTLDENGLRVTRLSLERIHENYAVMS